MKDLADFDVVVTTYEMLSAEANFFNRRFLWQLVIVDEGHRLKKDKSQLSENLKQASRVGYPDNCMKPRPPFPVLHAPRSPSPPCLLKAIFLLKQAICSSRASDLVHRKQAVYSSQTGDVLTPLAYIITAYVQPQPQTSELVVVVVVFPPICPPPTS